MPFLRLSSEPRENIGIFSIPFVDGEKILLTSFGTKKCF
jgi:hypothetical protein